MRKLRKGFTLLELLVVIAVMGVLGSMAMISGQEAMDVANASNIVSGFESVSAAMMMYYSEVSTSADQGADEITQDTILKGVQAYVKNENSVEALGDSGGTVGVYAISIEDDHSWWITYTLPAVNTRIGKILATKSTKMGFKTTAGGPTAFDATQAETVATVAMKVR